MFSLGNSLICAGLANVVSDVSSNMFSATDETAPAQHPSTASRVDHCIMLSNLA